MQAAISQILERPQQPQVADLLGAETETVCLQQVQAHAGVGVEPARHVQRQDGLARRVGPFDQRRAAVMAPDDAAER